jgi:CRP-like cAMP-binding protein
MIIREADLFHGVDEKVIMDIGAGAIEEHHPAGVTLFETAQNADFLYVLEEGSVDIVIGETEGEGLHFLASNLGEVFGWSALVDPFTYTATALTKTDVQLIKVPRDKVELAMQRYPKDGLVIMRHLAGIVATRLRQTYESLGYPLV